MNSTESLQARATEAFETDQWSDEQDRSDWFEAEAYAYAAQKDAAVEVSRKIRDALTGAKREVQEDYDRWETLATGQDTEEAEDSGYLIGYADGLREALRLLEGCGNDEHQEAK